MFSTKGMNFRNRTDEEIIEALRESHGLISLAAKKLGLSSANSLRARIKKSPELNQVLLEAREEVLDIAESGMIKRLEADDPNMIQFALRQLGANRGYVDSTHFSVKASVESVNANVDLGKLSLEELKQLNELINKSITNEDSD